MFEDHPDRRDDPRAAREQSPSVFPDLRGIGRSLARKRDAHFFFRKVVHQRESQFAGERGSADLVELLADEIHENGYDLVVLGVLRQRGAGCLDPSELYCCDFHDSSFALRAVK